MVIVLLLVLLFTPLLHLALKVIGKVLAANIGKLNKT